MAVKLSEEEKEFAKLDDEIYSLSIKIKKADPYHNPNEGLERRALIKLLEEKGVIKYIELMRMMKWLLKEDLKIIRAKNSINKAKGK